MKIKYNSKSHDLLKVAKVFNRPFTVKDVRHILCVFEKDSRVKESANILIKHGFLEIINEDCYLITPSGREELYKIVRYNSLKMRNTYELAD
jgi:predicted transcriptional regulator of viral defense system